MKSRSLFLSLVLGAQLVNAQQLGSAFAVDSPVTAAAGGDQLAPAVVWTGAQYFAVWSDDRDGRTADLWFNTFDSFGAPLTPLSLPLLRAPRQQQSPAAASGNGAVLVAWLDDSVCASEVVAGRFTPSGQPAGAVLPLSLGACPADRPSVAWDPGSSRWLVAWGSHGAGAEVHGALVAADGTVAVSDFVIASDLNSARAPWVTASAGVFQVAWADDRLTGGVPNIYLASVSSAGAVGGPVQVLPSGAAQSAPCVAPFAADLLISWVEGTSLFAQETTPAGVTVGAPMVVATGPLVDATCAEGPAGSVLLTSTDLRALGKGVFLHTVFGPGSISPEFEAAPRFSYFGREVPRLAVHGTDAMLVVRGPAGYVTSEDVLGRMLSVAGTPTADAGLFIVATAGDTVSHVSAAWDGTNYLAAWRSDGKSFAGSDSFGQLLAPGTGQWSIDGGLRFSTDSANVVSYPSVGGSTAGFFVTWGDDGSAGQLRGMPVSPQGMLGTSLLLDDVSSYVDTHTSRWLSDGWATASLKNGALQLRRTSLAGTVVFPETALVTTGTTTEQLDSASLDDVLLSVFLARDGGFDIRGARFAADGGLLDPGGFDIAHQVVDEVDPAVGAGATRFLVAWSQGGDVMASRVSRLGVVLDTPPLQLGVGAAIDQGPAVGWTGASFLVAWQRDGDVVAVRVDETGAVLDASPFVIADTAEVERRVRVASGPVGEALVTWEAFSESWGSFRPMARFVSETVIGVDGGVDAGVDAGPDDGGVISAADGGAVAPRAAWRLGVGCSCSGTDGVPMMWVLLVAALIRRQPSPRLPPPQRSGLLHQLRQVVAVRLDVRRLARRLR